MPFWREQALKCLILAATVAAIAGSLLLLVVGTIGNGSAIGSTDYDVRMTLVTVAIVFSQIALCIAGCRAGWRYIDKWSAEIRDQR
jgi:hypothetical protein